jgi:hypothetical protein
MLFLGKPYLENLVVYKYQSFLPVPQTKDEIELFFNSFSRDEYEQIYSSSTFQ